jgi:hypothetical protein
LALAQHLKDERIVKDGLGQGLADKGARKNLGADAFEGECGCGAISDRRGSGRAEESRAGALSMDLLEEPLDGVDAGECDDIEIDKAPHRLGNPGRVRRRPNGDQRQFDRLSAALTHKLRGDRGLPFRACDQDPFPGEGAQHGSEVEIAFATLDSLQGLHEIRIHGSRVDGRTFVLGSWCMAAGSIPKNAAPSRVPMA